MLFHIVPLSRNLRLTQKQTELESMFSGCQSSFLMVSHCCWSRMIWIYKYRIIVLQSFFNMSSMAVVCVRVLECELNMHICDMRRVITHIAVLGEQVWYKYRFAANHAAIRCQALDFDPGLARPTSSLLRQKDRRATAIEVCFVWQIQR